MRHLFKITILAASVSFTGMAFAAEPAQSTTLHQFMKDYMKPIGKLAKKGNEAPLLATLKEIPSYAANAEDKKHWEHLIQQAIAKDKAESACFACHKADKKRYQKEHKDLAISVSNELLAVVQDAVK